MLPYKTSVLIVIWLGNGRVQMLKCGHWLHLDHSLPSCLKYHRGELWYQPLCASDVFWAIIWVLTESVSCVKLLMFNQLLQWPIFCYYFLQEPGLLPFFKALQLAKKRGFYNGLAKMVWSTLYTSFIPQVGFRLVICPLTWFSEYYISM